MPYSSDKQRKYMNYAAKKGKIKQSIVDEYNTASKGLDLPERFNKLRAKLKKKSNVK